MGSTDYTNAARQRRYIARLKAAAKQAQGGVTNAKPCAACAAKDREIARLKAELATVTATTSRGPRAELTRLQSENAALREENAALKREGTDWSKAYSKLYGDHFGLFEENSALKKQLANARAAAPGVGPAEERAAGRLAREIDRLKEALTKAELKPAADPGEVGKLERQLKGAKTELRNLKVHQTLWRQTLDEARRANPVTITKEQFALLQKAFHPDPEHDTATPERKQQLLKAAQVFNAIKFNVPGRKEKPKPSK